MSTRITAIQVRDYMRIREADAKIDSDGTLILVGGENAQGKSSFLSAVESVLKGRDTTISQPVRQGALKAHCELTIDNRGHTIKVRREFIKELSGKESSRIVASIDGQPVQRAKDLVESLVSGVFLDPVRFVNADPIEQRNELTQLVGLDTSVIEAEIADARRAIENATREQDALERVYADRPEYPDAPEVEIDISDLARRLTEAREANDRRQAILVKRESLQSKRDFAAQQIKDLEAQIADLRQRIAEADQHLAEQVVPDPVPTEALETSISEADGVNAKVRANREKAAARDQWREAEQQLKERLEEERNLIKRQKQMLAECKFPIEGLGFDARHVTWNGKPLKQASHAEQLRVATAVALAQSKDAALKPIFIHDASTLDKASLKAVAEIAEANGAQIFAEIVANREGDGFDRECAIYFEHGQIVMPGEQAKPDPESRREALLDELLEGAAQ